MIGSPAPTVASCRIRRPRARAVCQSALAHDAAARERPLVGQHQVHAVGERRLQRGRGVVGGEVHQHRPGERVAGDVRDRLLGGRGAALAASASGRPLRFSAASAASRRGSRPCGSNTKPERSITRPPAGASAGRRTRPSSEASVRPIWPKPSSTTSIRSGWITDAAGDPGELEGRVDPPLRLGGLRGLTTTEMFSSDEPCAMATTLISRRGERGEHAGGDARRAVHAEADDRDRGHAGAHLDAVDLAPADLAVELAAPGSSRASSASGSGTLKQIECSDDAWEMSETEICRPCSASKVRAAIPGTPSMPLPVTVTSACPPAAVSALTGKRAGRHPLGDLGPGRVGIGERAGRSTGMRRPATGISARGCSTLAP